MQPLTNEQVARYGVEPGWRYAFEREVRWSDLDGFSHVNHCAHFGWFEDARNGYLEALGFPLVDADVPGPVIKETSCSYERSLSFRSPFLVTARTKWFGTTSFQMEYAIWSDGLIARGFAIAVWLRSRDSQKFPLPDSLCAAMAADGAQPRQSLVPGGAAKT